jgi:AraC-like DNA-binding protein
MMGDRYDEHAPSAALADHVVCLWTSVSTGDGVVPVRTHSVLPDGCMDIILDLGDSETGMDAPTPPVRERAFVVGAMTRPLIVVRRGHVRYLGVRFRPGRAAGALRLAASELTDERIPLSAVWADAQSLVDRIGEIRSLAGQLTALDAVLAKRVALAGAPPPEVDRAVGQILSARGRVAIESLSEMVGRSRQHLARVFGQHVGLSPKMLSRVVRARAALELLRRAPAPSRSALALDLGFYDQAHLITELRMLTGLTPGGWMQHR